MASRRTTLASLFATAALLTGCGSPHPAPPPATAAPAQPSSPATSAGNCEGVSAGAPGVLALHCQGTAHLAVTVDSATRDFTTGDCTDSLGIFLGQAGVQTEPGTYPAPLPDYASITFNTDSPTTTAQFTVNLGGKQYTPARDLVVTLSPDHKHVTLKGKANHDLKDILAAGADLPPLPVTISADCP